MSAPTAGSSMPTSARISGHTLVAGVIGDPVAHSLSPRIYNAAFDALGYDAVFGAFRVATGHLPAAIAGARALGLLGLSVTTPHKDAVARLADQKSPVVELLGAANCVVFSSGVSIAYSTDGDGLIDDLEHGVGFSPDGRRCCVLGAGGAARAVVLALAQAGARQVLVVNRTASRATAAAALAGVVGRVGSTEEIGDVDLVVNATSIGLGVGADADAGVTLGGCTAHGQLVVDLVYVPERTPFLLTAAAQGASVRNGLGMLVHQAAHQFELMTGEIAPVAVMWDAVRAASSKDER